MLAPNLLGIPNGNRDTPRVKVWSTTSPGGLLSGAGPRFRRQSPMPAPLLSTSPVNAAAALLRPLPSSARGRRRSVPCVVNGMARNDLFRSRAGTIILAIGLALGVWAVVIVIIGAVWGLF